MLAPLPIVFTAASFTLAAQQTGAAAGVAQKAQFDAQHRPITAGGLVKTGPSVFQDVAAQAGLTRWRSRAGTPEKRVIIEAKGSGVCLIDYDHDGRLDIYLVNGSIFGAHEGREESPHAALFRNNHDGTFTDVVAKAGGGNDRWHWAGRSGSWTRRGLCRSVQRRQNRRGYQ